MNTRMKGLFAAILMGTLLIFSVAGCGKKEQAPKDSPVTQTQETAAQEQAAQGTGQGVQDAEGTAPASGETPKPQDSPAQSSKPAETPKPQKGSLSVEGPGVKTPVSFTLEELQKMKEALVADDYFSLNNWGTKEYFRFKGISLWYLLSEKAGIKASAKKATFIADDGYTITYTIEEIKRTDYIDEQDPAKKYQMILAWEENGKAYDPEEGSPFRLVVGQKAAGDINKPNWVQHVKTIRVE